MRACRDLAEGAATRLSLERIEHRSATDGRIYASPGALRAKKMREHAQYLQKAVVL